MRLEMQADQIESVLARCNITAQVTGGTITPTWVRFHVRVATGPQASEIQRLTGRLAGALCVNDLRVARRGAAVEIEVRRSDPQRIILQDIIAAMNVPQMCCVLGLTGDGSPLLAKLDSIVVGNIMAPAEVVRTIVASLMMTHKPCELTFIDVARAANMIRDCERGGHRQSIIGVGIAEAVDTNLLQLGPRFGVHVVAIGHDHEGFGLRIIEDGTMMKAISIEGVDRFYPAEVEVDDEAADLPGMWGTIGLA